MTAAVVVVGSVNADLTVRVAAHPSPGETVIGRSMAVMSGGKGANQAVAAARLGARVAFVGAVGDDELARPATATLREAGVGLAALSVVPGATGVAVVTVAVDGENTIVVVPGANASVSAGVVNRHSDVVTGADVVVLQGEIPRDGIEAAARLARGRVVLNLAPVVELDPEVVRRADPLVVNEHEARGALALLGVADVQDGSHAGVVRALRTAGMRSVVVTLGPGGALVAGEGIDDIVHVPAPVVQAVDATGAGDAFVGALASRLAAGDPLLGAARLAVRVGAFSVRGEGTQASYPSADDELPEPP